MAIGERIRFFRNKNGMTQKHLGKMVGFPEKSADIRMNQYEAGARTPKEDLVKTLSGIFDVSPRALTLPDIDSYIGLMHTLFALEDIYGLKVDEADGQVCLKIDLTNGNQAIELHQMMCAWKAQAMKLAQGEITREQYDQWRYHYPEFDTTRKWVKMPSQELSDAMVKAFKKKLK